MADRNSPRAWPQTFVSNFYIIIISFIKTPGILTYNIKPRAIIKLDNNLTDLEYNLVPRSGGELKLLTHLFYSLYFQRVI